jgi:hypothetical protein
LGGEGGRGGTGGGGGGVAGGEGGAVPHITVTSSTDASPAHDGPRVYSKRKPAAWSVMCALSHALPWSPLNVHTTVPELATSDTVPIAEPYM